MSESQQNDLERLEREINKLAMVSTVNKVLIKSIMYRYSILITHLKNNVHFVYAKSCFMMFGPGLEFINTCRFEYLS